MPVLKRVKLTRLTDIEYKNRHEGDARLIPDCTVFKLGEGWPASESNWTKVDFVGVFILCVCLKPH